MPLSLGMDAPIRKRPYWQGGLKLSHGEYLNIWHARNKAQAAGDLDLDKRLRGLQLVGHEGYTQESAAEMLEVTENAVTRWVMKYRKGGLHALWTRKPRGSDPKLTRAQLDQLRIWVIRGPESCGYDTGVWDAHSVGDLIKRKFGVDYHPTSVRRVLRKLGFSRQVPKRVLAGADPQKQRGWLLREYPRIKKKQRTRAGSSSSRTRPCSSKRAP